MFYHHHFSGRSRPVIVSGSDDHYFPGLRATFLSALWSFPADSSIRLVVLDPGLSVVNRERLREDVERIAARKRQDCELDFIAVDLSRFSRFPSLRGANYLTYARLLLADTIDESEVVWIDCDFVVFRDLGEVFSTASRAALIAGCLDEGVRYLRNDTPLPELSESVHPYLNAGLLWMNLRQMREENFSERILEFMESHRAGLRFHDQTAINSFAVGRSELVSSCHNYLCAPWYRHNRATVAMIGEGNLHYLGGDKPWMGRTRLSCYARDLAWFDVLERLTDDAFGAERDHLESCLDGKGGHWAKLLYQKVSGSKEGREDRFQSVAELNDAMSGRYREQISEKVQSWYERNLPSRERVETNQGALSS